MRRNYFLMSVFPVEREMARAYIMAIMNNRAHRVLEDYTVFTRLKRNKKQRETVLLGNRMNKRDFILITNSTAVTLAKRLKLQLDYFFRNKKRLNRSGNWKTMFIANYFGEEPLNVVKLYHKGVDFSEDDIRAMMSLYFDGEFDRIETFEVLPKDLTEYHQIEFYLIETHEEKSLKGVSTTRYFLLLVP